MSVGLAAAVAGFAVLLVLPPSGARGDLRLVGLPLLGLARWQVVGGRARVAAERRADAVIETCDGIAADLRAGQPPRTALEAAAREWDRVLRPGGRAVFLVAEKEALAAPLKARGWKATRQTRIRLLGQLCTMSVWEKPW